MKLAFYKNGKGVFSKAIKFKQQYIDMLPAQFAQYSHVEVLFTNGKCFSSSERDGGTRFKKIEFKKNHWDFINIPMTKTEEAEVKKFCKAHEGEKYGWLEIITSQAFPIPLALEKSKQWYCSEICKRAIKQGVLTNIWKDFKCLFSDSTHDSPGKLYQTLSHLV